MMWRSRRRAYAQPLALPVMPAASESQLPTFLRLLARALEDLAMSEDLRQARELGALEPVRTEGEALEDAPSDPIRDLRHGRRRHPAKRRRRFDRLE